MLPATVLHPSWLSMPRALRITSLLATVAVSPLLAQQAPVTVDEVECLPLEESALLTASASDVSLGSSVRLYFRRLDDEGDFYYVAMHPAAGNRLWTVFPKPEDRSTSPLTDSWWEELKDRDWMEGRDRDWLESWLKEQENEPAEYYTTVHDSAGAELSRTTTTLVSVTSPDNCDVELSPAEHGWAGNLTVGETQVDQRSGPLHHWLCDGVVTRIGSDTIHRADEYCRACVVALVPPLTAAAAGLLAVGIIESEPPTEASPRQP